MIEKTPNSKVSPNTAKEYSSEKDQSLRPRDKYINLGCVLLLLTLSIILFFAGLGSYPFFDEDEPRFASAGREMLERSSYIVPYFNHKMRLNKPILFYWFEIASYKLFGINEFGARFWSAVFAVLLVIVTYLVSEKIIGSKAGFWASLSLSTSWLMLWLGRAAMTDSMLSFFIASCIFCFFIGFKGFRPAYYLCYIAASLAVLTKGPIGAFLPAVAIMPFLIQIKGVKKWLKEGYVLQGLLRRLRFTRVAAFLYYCFALVYRSHKGNRRIISEIFFIWRERWSVYRNCRRSQWKLVVFLCSSAGTVFSLECYVASIFCSH